jgi:hypothetical protein
MTAFIKKSFNLSADLAQRLDDFVAENPGISLTLVMNQALDAWLKNPSLSIKLPRSHTTEDIDAIFRDNAELMDDLSK